MIKNNDIWALVSDPHFSIRPNDEFFWGLQHQLIDIVQQNKVNTILFDGDLCNSKDNHSSILVNRVTDLLVELSKHVKQIYILRGNHDGIDPNNPYWRWLNHLEGIEFIHKMQHRLLNGRNVWFLPHSTDPVTEWKDLDLSSSVVFTHIAVDGVTVANGYKLETTLKPEFFDETLITWSGDIHDFQVLGKLNYIGSPYATTFGNNNFKGRVVVFDMHTLEYESKFLSFPNRLTYDCSSSDDFQHQAYLQPGDQVKVRLHLTQETMGSWRDTKEEIKQFVVNCKASMLFDMVKPKIESRTLVTASTKSNKGNPFEIYCASNNITPELQELGRSILNDKA